LGLHQLVLAQVWNGLNIIVSSPRRRRWVYHKVNDFATFVHLEKIIWELISWTRTLNVRDKVLSNLLELLSLHCSKSTNTACTKLLPELRLIQAQFLKLFSFRLNPHNFFAPGIIVQLFRINCKQSGVFFDLFFDAYLFFLRKSIASHVLKADHSLLSDHCCLYIHNIVVTICVALVIRLLLFSLFL